MTWIREVWTRVHRGAQGDESDIVVKITETSRHLFQIDIVRREEPTVWAHTAESLSQAQEHAERAVVQTFGHVCRKGCTEWSRVLHGDA